MILLATPGAWFALGIVVALAVMAAFALTANIPLDDEPPE